MESYLNNSKKAYFTENPVLSSLVVNVPYSVDSYTTAPKISKLLTFPFGVRIDTLSLASIIFKLIISLSSFMLVASTCIIAICLPIQSQNFQLHSAIETLTNQKLGLIATLQESTDCNRLFANADTFSLKDSEEVLHINNTSAIKSANKLKIKNYASLEFVGF